MKRLCVVLPAFLVLLPGATTAFSFIAAPSLSTRFSLPESIQSVLGAFAPKTSSSIDDKKRLDLRNVLLEECRSADTNAKNKRKRIEGIIEELAALSPIDATAESEFLQKKWLLEWTTEKEINLFVDWGISSEVTQTIDGALLQNLIEFQRGGGLGVSGELSVPDQGGKRTNFKFTTATLDLGKWGSYNIPPVRVGLAPFILMKSCALTAIVEMIC